MVKILRSPLLCEAGKDAKDAQVPLHTQKGEGRGKVSDRPANAVGEMRGELGD